jgi:hypothetical protein
MKDIGHQLADAMPPLSHLQCDECQQEREIGNVGGHFRYGWPTHCGKTMRLITMKEVENG